MILKDCILLLSKGLKAQNGNLGHVVNLLLARLVSNQDELSLEQWGVFWNYVGILEDPLGIWNTIVIVITHVGMNKLLLRRFFQRIVNNERIFRTVSHALSERTNFTPIEWYFIYVVVSFPLLEDFDEIIKEADADGDGSINAPTSVPVTAEPTADVGEDSDQEVQNMTSVMPSVDPGLCSAQVSNTDFGDDRALIVLACGCASKESVLGAELTSVLDQCQSGNSNDWLCISSFRKHIHHLLLLFQSILRLTLKSGGSRLGSPANKAETTVGILDTDSQALINICRLLLELMEVFEHYRYCSGELRSDIDGNGEVDTAPNLIGGYSMISNAATDFRSESAIEIRERLAVATEAENTNTPMEWLGDMIDIASQIVCEFVRCHCNISSFASLTKQDTAEKLDVIPSLISFTDTLQLMVCGVEPGRQLVALESLKYYLLPVQSRARQTQTGMSFGPGVSGHPGQTVLTSQANDDESLPSSLSSLLVEASSRNRINSAPLEKQRSSDGSAMGSSSTKASKTKSKAVPGASTAATTAVGRSPSPNSTATASASTSSRKGSSKTPPMAAPMPPVKRATSLAASGSTDALLRKTGSGRGNPSPNRGPNIVEEVCKNGVIRILTWFLMHVSRRARELSCEILETCMRSDAHSLSVLYVNIMEQGLIPLLHLVRQGRAGTCIDSGKPMLFPEDNVRDCASKLVLSCQAYLCRDALGSGQQQQTASTSGDGGSIGIGFSVKMKPPTAGTGSIGLHISRLKNALIYSGNNRLKLNLFCAFIYLCIRSRTDLMTTNALDNSVCAGDSSVGSSSVNVNSALNLYGDPADSNTVGGADGGAVAYLPLFEQVLLGTVPSAGGGGGGSAPGNVVALYSFVAVIIHMYREFLVHRETEVCAISGRVAETRLQMEADRKSELQWHPTVCIQSAPSSHRAGAGVGTAQEQMFVKMQCPTVAVLQREAHILLAAMQELSVVGSGDDGASEVGSMAMVEGTTSSPPILLIKQRLVVPRSAVHEEECSTPANPDSVAGTTTGFAAASMGQDSSSVAAVAFTYGVYPHWQEIFSHIVDEYLLQMGTRKLSLEFLLHCLTIAHTYRMDGLCSSYVDIIIKRYLVDSSGDTYGAYGSSGNSSSKSGRDGPRASMDTLIKIFTAAFMDSQAKTGPIVSGREGAFDSLELELEPGTDLFTQLTMTTIRAARVRLVLACLQYTLPRLEALFANSGYPSTRPGSQYLINQQNQQQLIGLIFRSLKLLLSASSGLKHSTNRSSGTYL